MAGERVWRANGIGAFVNNLFPQRDEIAKLRAELATAKERLAELEKELAWARHHLDSMPVEFEPEEGEDG